MPLLKQFYLVFLFGIFLYVVAYYYATSATGHGTALRSCRKQIFLGGPRPPAHIILRWCGVKF